MPTSSPPEIQLQACLANTESVSEYRFLVDGKHVKYVTVDPSVIPAEEVSFFPTIKSCLPAFPPGNWNEGHVTKDKSTGEAVFATTTYRTLPGVENVWHSTQADHLELEWVDRLRQNIRRVTCPIFGSPVVYKFAEFPWQIPFLDLETTAYS